MLVTVTKLWAALQNATQFVEFLVLILSAKQNFLSLSVICRV